MSYFSTFSWFYTFSGELLAFFCGIVIFASKKGTTNHGTLGKLFIFGMLLTGVTSLLMALLHPSIFLFMVGVFTLYLIGTGARAIFSKNSKSNHSVDRFLQFGMAVAGLALGYFGLKGVLSGNTFGIVYLAFACIGLLMTLQDIRNSAKQHDKKAYVRKHLQRLGGGFIASATAFLVVNLSDLPEWFPSWTLWLLPTLLISPLISFWSKKYKTSS